MASVLPRVGRLAGARLARTSVPAPGLPMADHARVPASHDGDRRADGASGARPLLPRAVHLAGTAGDGVPGGPDAQRAAYRAPGHRALSRGPHADPVRRTLRPRMGWLCAPARLRRRLILTFSFTWRRRASRLSRASLSAWPLLLGCLVRGQLRIGLGYGIGS